MKTSISSSERLQLIGLLSLAHQNEERVIAARDAAVELLGGAGGDNAVSDHLSDAIWGSANYNPVTEADAVLDRLGIPVEK